MILTFLNNKLVVSNWTAVNAIAKIKNMIELICPLVDTVIEIMAPSVLMTPDILLPVTVALVYFICFF